MLFPTKQRSHSAFLLLFEQSFCLMDTLKIPFFSFRNVSTGAPEVMVNFVTSCYEPELLVPLVDRITKISEVVYN